MYGDNLLAYHSPFRPDRLELGPLKGISFEHRSQVVCYLHHTRSFRHHFGHGMDNHSQVSYACESSKIVNLTVGKLVAPV